MSRGPSRSSTPSRLHSSISSSVLLGGASSSRAKLPPPKVLPWPDMSHHRPTMSRENSRGTSPLTSPALSPGASYADALSLAIPGIPISASAHDLRLPSRSNNDSSRIAHSASPSGSTADLTTPRPLRPRAATTSAAPFASSSAAASGSAAPATSTPPPNRQVEFHPVAPSPVNPVLSSSNLMPTPSTTHNNFLAAPVPQSPTSARPASIVHDPTPPPAAATVSRPVSTKKSSNPPVPLPLSIPVSPQPPHGPLVDHLYRSFRTGACADVRLWVRRWNVGWLVHRMVLIQAGFFHSLFMGGFAETQKAKGKGHASHFDDEWQGEDIELVFDDHNITRAAFEICLSRLYSKYPQFHFPVALMPTAAQPLTPSFPPGAPLPSLEKAYHSLPQNIQLATPRLLLSLLATATYLGLPYLLREVLAIVLRTVGPATVVRYLGFAIGDGIGEPEWDGQDDEGARGLEKIARTVSSGLTAHESDEWISEVESDGASHDFHEVASPGQIPHRTSTDSSASDEGNVKVGDTTVSRSASVKSNSTARPTSGGPSLTPVDEGPTVSPLNATLPHFYGFVSDKVGEACVCWLSRWGMDVLNVETSQPKSLPGEDEMPPVWGYGGIPPKFVSAVLSSDALFVPNERGRYHMARRVFNLRRDGYSNEDVEDDGEYDPWEDEEREIAKVFANGIYYSHMNFEDLSTISSDIDPDTALPYAPLPVLQAAYWSAADLKTRITSGKAINSARDGELDLAKTTSEICSLYARRRNGRGRGSQSPPIGPGSALTFSALSQVSSPFASSPTTGLFHPIPDDETHRIGAGGMLFLNHVAPTETLPSILGMPDLGPEWGTPVGEPKRSKSDPPTHGEGTSFGLQRGARLGPDIDARFREEGGVIIPLPGMDSGKLERWSKTEPFRFSVEFWGVDKLAEKERLYSQTHFYAGSYFNVYVSTIRKKDKGVQLGIYLHRQAANEPFPAVSSARAQTGTPPPIFDEQMPAVTRTFSISQPVLGSPELRRSSLPETGDEPPDSMYTDPREVTKAYFSISCASALGTALVRFSSAPDSFAISQSWGWKSSALRSEEYLSVPVSGDELGWVGESEGGSLRATVVVGII